MDEWGCIKAGKNKQQFFFFFVNGCQQVNGQKRKRKGRVFFVVSVYQWGHSNVIKHCQEKSLEYTKSTPAASKLVFFSKDVYLLKTFECDIILKVSIWRNVELCISFFAIGILGCNFKNRIFIFIHFFHCHIQTIYDSFGHTFTDHKSDITFFKFLIFIIANVMNCNKDLSR